MPIDRLMRICQRVSDFKDNIFNLLGFQKQESKLTYEANKIYAAGKDTGMYANLKKDYGNDSKTIYAFMEAGRPYGVKPISGQKEKRK